MKQLRFLLPLHNNIDLGYDKKVLLVYLNVAVSFRTLAALWEHDCGSPLSRSNKLSVEITIKPYQHRAFF